MCAHLSVLLRIATSLVRGVRWWCLHDDTKTRNTEGRCLLWVVGRQSIHQYRAKSAQKVIHDTKAEWVRCTMVVLHHHDVPRGVTHRPNSQQQEHQQIGRSPRHQHIE